MTPGFQSYIQEVAVNGIPSFKDISKFSPADIREGIQSLVTEDKMDLAQALCDAGISLYPESEDILAIAGLLAITRMDWPLAIELLSDLCTVQEGLIQPMTYQMLARALWCNLDLSQARYIIDEGLKAYPAHPVLLAEQAEMAVAENAMPANLSHN